MTWSPPTMSLEPPLYIRPQPIKTFSTSCTELDSRKSYGGALCSYSGTIGGGPDLEQQRARRLRSPIDHRPAGGRRLQRRRCRTGRDTRERRRCAVAVAVPLRATVKTVRNAGGGAVNEIQS